MCVHSPAMFEGPSGSGKVSQEQLDDGSSSEEEPGLGFFQPAESDDSDTEVSWRSKLQGAMIKLHTDKQINCYVMYTNVKKKFYFLFSTLTGAKTEVTIL